MAIHVTDIDSDPPLRDSAIDGEYAQWLQTPRGAGTWISVAPVPAARAAVMLFPGSHGAMHIAADNSKCWGESNFLVRTRHLFHACNISTVLVDVPSDRKSGHGLYGFRSHRDHADDIASVAAQVRRKLDVPLWLVGTSRGAESVANAASKVSGVPPFDGAAFVAATTRAEPDAADRREMPGCIFDSDLSAIRIPCLIVHHRDDACHLSPAADVERLEQALCNAPEVYRLIFSGKTATPRSGPCNGLHAHGFFGIEARVIAEMAAHINSRS